MQTPIQSLVFDSWLAVSAVIIIFFVLVYIHSVKNPTDMDYAVVNRRRLKLFYVFVAGFLLLFFLALMHAPYSTAGEPDDIVGVKARMFSFALTKDTVRCGQVVEFRVSTEDVTHGFGIYTTSGTLLGQVQIMPGYVNRLRMRFETPGQYDILCLEYCGPLHHQMRSSIIAR